MGLRFLAKQGVADPFLCRMIPGRPFSTGSYESGEVLSPIEGQIICMRHTYKRRRREGRALEIPSTSTFQVFQVGYGIFFLSITKRKESSLPMSSLFNPIGNRINNGIGRKEKSLRT